MIKQKEEQVISITEDHQYKISSILIHQFDGESIGTLELYNTCSDTTEEYSIWQGDCDFSWFYVCLPIGDDEDDLYEVINIDNFGINLDSYADLKW